MMAIAFDTSLRHAADALFRIEGWLPVIRHFRHYATLATLMPLGATPAIAAG
jgi:hypothetical protein